MDLACFDVTLVLVTRDRADLTLAFVQALAKVSPPSDFEVVIVDNGSSDATSALLAILGGDVKTIRNDREAGFAAACNQGAAVAAGRHLVFAEARCEPLAGWMRAMVGLLDAHAQIGAVAPRLIAPDTTMHSGGLALASRGQTLEAVPRLRGIPASDSRSATPREVDAASSTCMAVRREAFESLGGFDEGYLHGGGDVELCLAIADAGWKIVYEPAAMLMVKGTSLPGCGDLVLCAADRDRLNRRWGTRVAPSVDLGGDGAPREVRRHLREARSGHRGANVAGFFDAELGIGQSARLVVDALEASSVDVVSSSYYRHLNRAAQRFERRGDASSPWDLNIICVNGDMLGLFALEAGERFFRDRYSVAMWHWELEELPESHVRAIDLVDEIWVGSEFTRAAVSACTDKTVRTVPLPVARRRGGSVEAHSREEMGIPEGFVFGFMYDANSIAARKNPDGLISAFCDAFEDGEGPALVVKTINAGARPDVAAALARQASRRSDITVVDRYLDRSQVGAWTGLVDCYVSLHRSEGFGLTIAEAMSWGTAVIATAYSGNLDYMTDDNSYLVPWVPAEVPADAAPYPRGARWAEPDMACASAMLRSVWEDPDGARARGARGKADIARTHGIEAAKAVVEERLEAIEATMAARRKRAHSAKPSPCPTLVPHPDFGTGVRFGTADSALPADASAPLRLNLGAGDEPRRGFVSIDMRRDVADVVAALERLPFPGATVAEILASDVLEHFPASRTAELLAEWNRVAVMGAKITVRVPNLLALAQLLVAHPHTRVNVIRNIYGGHRWGPDGAWDTHHTGWTPDMLAAELVAAGFVVLSDDGDTNNTVVAMKVAEPSRQRA